MKTVEGQKEVMQILADKAKKEGRAPR
jgi:hypothetical protein